jgi:hypothetical protein
LCIVLLRSPALRPRRGEPPARLDDRRAGIVPAAFGLRLAIGAKSSESTISGAECAPPSRAATARLIAS